ncbi:MAG: release factor glutamine methyltransferase [Fusobacteria bacterium]|nr:MAG: release factor glutamine methyltransferase [Fusobacteriota bacterium]KAF0228894.1 MAG: release factor glutamine [Fusobacteriota bacterium]
MNIEDILKKAHSKLRNTQYGKLEAEVILANLLNKERVYLHINNKEELDDRIIDSFESNVEELINNKPLQYITGKQEWMGLSFKVNENVLIPREDTRILLEQILKFKDTFELPIILEIGTGSGILPVVLKKNWPQARLIVTEISKDTLEVARENFKQHNVEIKSYNCDFLDDIKANSIKADIIFSNPPYISEEEYLELDEEVKREPYGALVGGTDGLDYYRRLAEEYIDVVRDRAYILLELGCQQYEIVRKILEEKGLKFIGIYKDDGNRNRVLVMEHINYEN